jgi:hypothetical protein
MADAFLEEQLKRIRHLTERMSRVTTSELENDIARTRGAVENGPLEAVRDVRVVDVPPWKATDSRTRRRGRRRR